MIMARPKELRHLYVIRKVLDKEITQVKASEILSLSSRQIRRILKRVRREGDKGVIHKSRGRPSNRRIPDTIREKVHPTVSVPVLGFWPDVGIGETSGKGPGEGQ